MKDENVDYIIYLLKKYTKEDNIKPKKEMGEQESSGGGGGAGGASGGKGYPSVTKWSSGRKFGPTYNPEQKKWASGLNRGKANTLL